MDHLRRARTSGGSRIERRRIIMAGVAAGVGSTALAVAVTASQTASAHPWLAAFARGTIVAVPVAVGLYATTRPPYARLGRVLALVGVAAGLAALAESTDSVAYSAGRVAAWAVEVALVWVILAFPSGWLAGRWDRPLVVGFALVALVGFLPTALLADGYPSPSPWAECGDSCPPNAFQVVDEEPAFVDDVVRPIREGLVILVFVGVGLVVAARWWSATRLTRLMLGPVVVVAVARLAVYIVGFVGRRADADAALLGPVAWTIALLIPAMALAFLVGLVRWHVFSAGALQRLALLLHEHPDGARVRVALAATLGDPWLDLAFRRNDPEGGWVDADGTPVDLDAIGEGRSVTTIKDGGAPVAAIVHDAALDEQPEFVAAAGNFAAIALENQLLLARVRSSLREVRASRGRILASADAERRRIERDLHDGAQQRLVALRIKLELAEEMLPHDPRRGRELLHEIGDETIEALEDVRSLAHGVYPVILTQRGLRDALHDAALRSPVAVRLQAEGIGRYPPEVETAVYFCCLEAMQNAVKHASSVTLIAIGLTDDGELRFEVSDDGAGFDPATTQPGAGLANMRDRLAAVGGDLTYRSEVGVGTSVIGVVPQHG